MEKKHFMIPLAAVVMALAVIVGCGTSTAEKNKIKQEQSEAAKLDSLSAKIDQAKNDITTSVKELEELVNDL